MDRILFDAIYKAHLQTPVFTQKTLEKTIDQ